LLSAARRLCHAVPGRNGNPQNDRELRSLDGDGRFGSETPPEMPELVASGLGDLRTHNRETAASVLRRCARRRYGAEVAITQTVLGTQYSVLSTRYSVLSHAR